MYDDSRDFLYVFFSLFVLTLIIFLWHMFWSWTDENSDQFVDLYLAIESFIKGIL